MLPANYKGASFLWYRYLAKNWKTNA